MARFAACPAERRCAGLRHIARSPRNVGGSARDARRRTLMHQFPAYRTFPAECWCVSASPRSPARAGRKRSVADRTDISASMAASIRKRSVADRTAISASIGASIRERSVADRTAISATIAIRERSVAHRTAISASMAAAIRECVSRRRCRSSTSRRGSLRRVRSRSRGCGLRSRRRARGCRRRVARGRLRRRHPGRWPTGA
jgi:hypothetical protein